MRKQIVFVVIGFVLSFFLIKLFDYFGLNMDGTMYPAFAFIPSVFSFFMISSVAKKLEVKRPTIYRIVRIISLWFGLVFVGFIIAFIFNWLISGNTKL